MVVVLRWPGRLIAASHFMRSVSAWLSSRSPACVWNGYTTHFFMDMDLHRGPAGEGPPGALFPGLDQRRQGFQHQFGTVMRSVPQLVQPLHQGGAPCFLFRSQVQLETYRDLLWSNHRGYLRQQLALTRDQRVPLFLLS